MDFSALVTPLQNALGSQLPRILGAIGILIIGWLVAVLARAGVLRLLELLSVNLRIRESTGQSLEVEEWIAIGGRIVVGVDFALRFARQDARLLERHGWKRSELQPAPASLNAIARCELDEPAG